MDFKFDKETTGGEAPARSQEKGKQTGLLMVLLVLLGGFGYIYFFTGLIRPQEQPPVPQPTPQVVKQPLPSRDAAPPSIAKPAEQQTVAAPLSPAVPAATPAQKTADAKAANAAVPKPQSGKTAAKQEPVKTAAAAPAAQKAEPAKAVAPVAKADSKKVEPAKVEEKKSVVAEKPQAKLTEPVKKQVAVAPKLQGPWTVVVGLYVVEETLADDMAKVKKVGLSPVMTSGPKRPVAMNRLFYGEYTSKHDAQQAVELLRRVAGSGFLMQRGEKHEVYAGSYAVLSGAQTEQQRLATSGVKVMIRKSQVPLASRKLTAGTFTDRAAATETLKKLRTAGFNTATIE